MRPEQIFHTSVGQELGLTDSLLDCFNDAEFEQISDQLI